MQLRSQTSIFRPLRGPEFSIHCGVPENGNVALSYGTVEKMDFVVIMERSRIEREFRFPTMCFVRLDDRISFELLEV